MSEESPLPTSTRRLFGAGNMLILLVIMITLLSLFAIQLDLAVPSFHSAWSSAVNNDSHTVSPIIDQDMGAKYRLATQMLHVPSIDEIRHLPNNYKWYSDAKLRWLAACLARGDCPENADKVAIFATFHCQWALYEEYHGGEGIWCLGMMEALEAQGFTVLHGGENDWEYIYHIHRQIPDLVRVIVSEPGDPKRHGVMEDFIKTKDRPEGIPAWKYFAMSYYPAGWTTTVGHAWVITAEPSVGDEWDVSINPATGNAWCRTGEEDLHIYAYPDRYRFTYTGYAVDPQPGEADIVPWEERPNRVWIMGKYAHYFHNGHQQVYDMDMWERAHNELSKEFPGFEFMGAIEDKRSEEEKQKWGPIPKVINNVGRLNKTEFLRAFGSSKLMVGLGAPTLSPSPYQALAKAVPFANPHVLPKGGKNDDDRTWGFTQHESLNRVPEPYVYQVEAFNYESFVNTIRKALTTPIGQFRFERMKTDVVQRRMAAFVTADWKSVAKDVLEARLNGTNNEGEATGLFDL